jgi:hypothetical protein
MTTRIPIGSTAIHLPTSARCTILLHRAGYSFCNFGSRCNPFTWVIDGELWDTGTRGERNAVNYDKTGFIRPC